MHPSSTIMLAFTLITISFPEALVHILNHVTSTHSVSNVYVIFLYSVVILSCVCECQWVCVCVWCVTTAIFFSSPNILSFHSYVRRTLYPFITISHVHKTEDINITKYSVFILSSKVLSVSVCACVCVCSHRKAFSFHP